MDIYESQWQSLADLSIKDIYNKNWDCDAFSIFFEQVSKIKEDVPKDSFDNILGHYKNYYRKFSCSTSELIETDLEECIDLYLNEADRKKIDLIVSEGTKAVPDACVLISRKSGKARLEVSSAWIFYLNHAMQVYFYLSRPSFSSDVSHDSRIDLALESLRYSVSIGKGLSYSLDRHLMIELITSVEHFYSPNPERKLKTLSLPTAPHIIPIVVRYARQFMVMHEIAHILNKDSFENLDNYTEEILADGLAILLMFNGLYRRNDLDDHQKMTEASFMLQGVLMFLHCLSIPYRVFDWQKDIQTPMIDEKSSSRPNPLIREMAIIKSLYESNYFNEDSPLAHECLRYLFELSPITLQPEYFLLLEKERKFIPFVPSSDNYHFNFLNMAETDPEFQKILSTVVKLRQNTFDVYTPRHSLGIKILDDFVPVFFGILNSAFNSYTKYGYFPNRGKAYESGIQELRAFSTGFFEVRSSHLFGENFRTFQNYVGSKIDDILGTNF